MTVELDRDELHVSLTEPESASMNFLNEVAARFPDAISLAAGRPYDGFHTKEDVHRYLRTPEGGFFAVVDVPLTADEAMLEASGRDYGVRWTPMAFFYAHGSGGGRRSLRLSCGALRWDRIEEGVRRLARLVPERGAPAGVAG